MDFANIHGVPEWDNHQMLHRRFEGGEWKKTPRMEAAGQLSNKLSEKWIYSGHCSKPGWQRL